MPHLESRETQYSLRPHPLPVPRVTLLHMHNAESCLLYKLIEMKNKLATSHKLIFNKIVNRTHSHSAFSKRNTKYEIFYIDINITILK